MRLGAVIVSDQLLTSPARLKIIPSDRAYISVLATIQRRYIYIYIYRARERDARRLKGISGVLVRDGDDDDDDDGGDDDDDGDDDGNP